MKYTVPGHCHLNLVDENESLALTMTFATYGPVDICDWAYVLICMCFKLYLHIGLCNYDKAATPPPATLFILVCRFLNGSRSQAPQPFTQLLYFIIIAMIERDRMQPRRHLRVVEPGPDHSLESCTDIKILSANRLTAKFWYPQPIRSVEKIENPIRRQKSHPQLIRPDQKGHNTDPIRG